MKGEQGHGMYGILRVFWAVQIVGARENSCGLQQRIFLLSCFCISVTILMLSKMHGVVFCPCWINLLNCVCRDIAVCKKYAFIVLCAVNVGLERS